jgi:branched-chain amino acid transport system ATP-binding protein
MLTLKNVNAGYGDFQALFDVSLDVRAGEAVAVIGPNGAGKSTLMRVISGMIPATVGHIEMEGVSVLDAPAHDIVGMGIAHVPENRRLFPRMTVEDNLRMGCFMPQFRAKYEARKDFVYELFPRMLERRNQMAGTLSGGEQQMCAIGRALMSDPKILLMDDLIERIRAEGLTVLIVEQNVRQVLRIVDRAYVLESGSLRLEGTADELLQSAEIQKSFMGM